MTLLSYALLTTYAAGSGPISIAVADLNGDGNPDVIVSNYNNATISVLYGQGGGVFTASQTYTLASGSYGVVVADINGDGLYDLVATDSGSNQVSVLYGDVGGGFTAQSLYPTGSVPVDVAVADLNKDGYEDIITTDIGDGTLTILYGNAAGGFDLPSTYVIGGNPYGLAVADLNGDGLPDIVATESASNTVVVLYGNASGGFDAPVTYVVGNAPVAVAIVDVNGDGRPDLVVANNADNTVSILFGQDGGGFSTATTYAVGSQPYGLVVADLNGDGVPDIAVSSMGAGTVSVLYGDGNGGFSAQTTYATGSMAPGVVAADVNNDGNPDLLTTDYVNGVISILLNLPGPHVDSLVASVSSGTLRTGQTITFTLYVSAAVLVTASGDGAVPSLMLSNGKSATYDAAASSDTALVFTNTVVSGDDTSDLRVTGLSLNGGSITGVGTTSSTAITDAISEYNASSYAGFVTTADLNGDGKDEVIATNTDSDSIVVMYNDGTGGFASQTTYTVGSTPYSVAVADFNGDGRPDMAVANEDGSVSILLANSNGGFDAQTTYATGATSHAVVAADLNNDGVQDIVVANRGDNTVSVLYGDGSGGFGAQTSYVTGSSPVSVAIADLNGDGLGDIVTADYNDGVVSVLYGLAGGGFSSPSDYAAGQAPSAVAIADLNGDGLLDMIVTNRDDNTVSILYGLAGGDFQAQVTYATGSGPNAVSVADMNGDGSPDLVIGDVDSSDVVVLFNNGSGEFDTSTTYSSGSGSNAVAVADLDGNGLQDIVSSSSGAQVRLRDAASTVQTNSSGTQALDTSSLALDTGVAIDTQTATGGGTSSGTGSSTEGQIVTSLIAARIVTNLSNPTLSGASTAGAVVTISLDNVVLGTTTADQSGDWSFVLSSGIAIGIHQVGVIAVDGLGTSQSSTAQLIAGTQAINSVLKSIDSSSITTFTTIFTADTLKQFEDGTQTVQLDDGVLSLTSNTQQAYVQRLYVGLLGRSNDGTGFGFWNDQLANAGQNAVKVAQDFLDSAEYQSLKGNVSDQDYVRDLYTGLLDRDASDSETTYWTDQLQGGASRAQIASAIAMSDESMQALSGQTNALQDVNPAAQFVIFTYQAALGRMPEQSGFQFWTQLLSQGASTLDVMQAFMQTPEYQSSYASESAAQGLATLYGNATNVQASAETISALVDGINNGAQSMASSLVGIVSAQNTYDHLSQYL